MTALYGPLAGRRVAVTRPRTGELEQRLAALGATVDWVPLIEFVPPDDGGALLAATLDALDDVDWVVVTSATALDVLATAGASPERFMGCRIAAVGPATARRVGSFGRQVDLVPPAAVAESLVEVFPHGSGRVVLFRPEVARDVIAPGLRRKGWQVDEVAAYRTVTRVLDGEDLAALRAADAVTFSSPSVVDGFFDQVRDPTVPVRVVSIGPVTSRALRQKGIEPAAEADPHTAEGLVAATLRALG